jgi:hypothetical protein
MAPCVRFSLLGKAVARLIGFCPVCVSWQKRSVTAPFGHKVDDFDIALDGTTAVHAYMGADHTKATAPFPMRRMRRFSVSVTTCK